LIRKHGASELDWKRELNPHQTMFQMLLKEIFIDRRF
jgi:hypothetical protein